VRAPPRIDLAKSALEADVPEEALKALIAVDPEADPDIGDEDVQKIVSGALADSKLEKP
jgi:hypothetical protein